MQFRTAIAAAGVILAMHLIPTVASASQHGAVSAPVTLDARAPEVVVLAPVGDEIIYGFDQTQFSWTVSETHPSPADSDRSALVRINGQPFVAAGFPAAEGRHDWLWTAPDLSSGNCVLEVTARDAFGNTTVTTSGAFTILLQGTGVPGGVPTHSHLSGPRPNPFNPSTSLHFGLAEAGPTRLLVHDLRGRVIRTLLDQTMPAGSWQVPWNGRDDQGRPVSGGTYIARLIHAGREVMTQKVVMLP